MTVTDRLLAKLPVVGPKIQGLRGTLTTIQGEIGRLGTQLAGQEVELATRVADYAGSNVRAHRR